MRGVLLPSKPSGRAQENGLAFLGRLREWDKEVKMKVFAVRQGAICERFVFVSAEDANEAKSVVMDYDFSENQATAWKDVADLETGEATEFVQWEGRQR